MRRWARNEELLCLFHCGARQAAIGVPFPAGTWDSIFDSTDARWGGPGSDLPQRVASSGTAALPVPPWSVAVYGRRT